MHVVDYPNPQILSRNPKPDTRKQETTNESEEIVRAVDYPDT